MKRSIRLLEGCLLLALTLFAFSACQKNGSNPVPRETQYQIVSYPGYNVSGTATFKEVINADSVWVTIKLQGSTVSDVTSFPIYIREGTSLENGDKKFDLGNFDGSKGTLTKEIALSYDELNNFNGSIAVYRNPTDVSTLIAQGELGINGIYKSYTMHFPGSSDINGVFRVYKRGNGTYVVIKNTFDNLDTLCAGHPHPAGVFKANGAPDFQLNPVADSSGISATALDNHTFDEMTHYQGSIKVLCSDAVQSFVLSQGEFK